MDITYVRSMEKTLEVISLEASVLSNVTSTIKNFFPDLVSNFKTSYLSAANIEKTEPKFNKLEKELIEFLKKHNYIDLMEVPVTVPEGFYAEFLKATSVIDKATEIIIGLISKDISEFRVYVSTFITQRDAKISLKDMSTSYAHTKTTVKQINEMFAELYRDNSFETSLPLKLLVKRSSDIETVFNHSNNTKKKLNQIDITALKSQLQDIASLLDTVIRMVQENKIENVSPEAVRNLSEGTQAMAQVAETISATYFRSMGIIAAIDRLPQELITNYK